MQNFKDINLLFLENDRNIIKNFMPIFNMLFAKTYLSKNIEISFDLFIKEDIHLIIVDKDLKEECGIDFIEKVREKNQLIPIILISNEKSEELLFRVITLNLSGFLLKPINYYQLENILDKCKFKIKTIPEIVELKNGYRYNKTLRKLIKNNETYQLNKKEILFMEILSSNKYSIVNRDIIIKNVYENKITTNKAINNFDIMYH